MENELTYTDEQGNKLYGFSQTNLEILNKRIRMLTYVLIIFLILFVLVGGYVLYWMHSHDYLTKILEAIVGRN